MITSELRNSLQQAEQALLAAESELNRPHEDVVTLSACQSVRDSMRQMMHLYLSAHDKDSAGKTSIEDLVNASAQVNPVFSSVDISNIECKGLGHENCDGKYCLSIANVTCCIKAANQVRDIVWKEFKVND